MPTIRIHRTKEFKSSVRSIKIENNGREIGSIANGETKDFMIAPGNHYLKATLDSICTSNPVELFVNENDLVEFKLSHKGGIALINMIFDNKNYFILEKLTR